MGNNSNSSHDERTVGLAITLSRLDLNVREKLNLQGWGMLVIVTNFLCKTAFSRSKDKK